MRRRNLWLLPLLLGLLQCTSTQPQNTKTTQALFAFAPKNTQLAITIRDVSTLSQTSSAALQKLSHAPAVAQLASEFREYSEEKLGRDPLDPAFLQSLSIAPEQGAALFFVGDTLQPVFVLGVRELEPFLTSLRYQSKKILGAEMRVTRRSKGAIYDCSVAGNALPDFILGYRSGYVFAAAQEEIVTELAESGNGLPWSYVEEHSRLAREPHDVLLFMSLGSGVGLDVRKKYEALPIVGKHIASMQSLSASLLLEAPHLALDLFAETSRGKDIAPLLETTPSRGELLSVASQQTRLSASVRIQPRLLWQQYQETPAAAESSPQTLAERFQNATGVKLTDPRSGFLDSLTGDIALLAGPSLLRAALLIGVQKTEPSQKLLAALWKVLPTPSDESTWKLTTEQREEAGQPIYHATLQHKALPIPLVFTAAVSRDALLFSIGEGWWEQLSARGGKSARSYLRGLYERDTQALFASKPPFLLYWEIQDPLQGFENTPGELAQTLETSLQQPGLSRGIALLRAALERLYDLSLALQLHPDGVALTLRLTTL